MPDGETDTRPKTMQAEGSDDAQCADPRLSPCASERIDGYLPLENYGVLGEGRSIALSGADGSIDWWCAPKLDSPPLFDRLLDAETGGYFSISPDAPFTAERSYRSESNVLETVFTTDTGKARLTESLNSGSAGRLPWNELARRIEGIEGSVTFDVAMRIGRRANNASPYLTYIDDHPVFHVGRLCGLFLHSEELSIEQDDHGARGSFSVSKGERRLVAIVASEDQPLVVPSVSEIDDRIDLSDAEWKQWSKGVLCLGDKRDEFLRSVLALKLLITSHSGAIAAAGTTSLPEGIGGEKNWDYRYAWIRDAGYAIKAFLAADRQQEAAASLTWLLRRIKEYGPLVCFTIDGDLVPGVEELDMPGYRHSRPVVTGNKACGQHQHGVYGDILETAWYFVDHGNVLDPDSAMLLSGIADECADRWRLPDAGIWELPETRHYTMSKISCWQALTRAVQLADRNQLPTVCRDRWARERDRVAAWVEENCWSEEKQAFVFYPGSDRLDASLALAVRFGFDGEERLRATLSAIDRELGAGAFHYRYTGAREEEGAFLVCTFWMAEAWAIMGERDKGRSMVEKATKGLDRGIGVWSEMVDPATGHYLGNFPQGLTHLAHIQALARLAD